MPLATSVLDTAWLPLPRASLEFGWSLTCAGLYFLACLAIRWVAAAPDIKSGTINATDTLDLAPTFLTLLGQPLPAEMEGKPLKLMG